jgi:hypothetical protein
MPVLTAPDSTVDKIAFNQVLAVVLLFVSILALLWWGDIAIEHTHNGTMDDAGVNIALPAASLGIGCAIWSYRRFKRARMLKQVTEPVSHSFIIKREFMANVYTFEIAVQWPLRFDLQWDKPAKPTYPPSAAQTQILERFRSDISAAISKSLEAHESTIRAQEHQYSLAKRTDPNVSPPDIPPYETFVSTTNIERALEPAMKFLQTSLQIPFIKYDCLAVERPAPPAAKPQNPDGVIIGGI